MHDDEFCVRGKLCAGSETAEGGRTDLARERATEKMYRPGRLYPLGELGGRIQQQNFGETPGIWNSVLWRLHFTEMV